MFEKQQHLDVSRKDFDLIEAALQTQSKILLVQAGAGSADSRRKSNEIKSLLARLESQKMTGKSCRVAKMRLPFLRWMTS